MCRFAAAAGCGIGRVAVFVNGQVLAVGAGTDGKVNAGHQAVRCSQQGILPRQDLVPESRIIPHHGASVIRQWGWKIRQRILGLAALKVGPAQHIGHKAPQPADAKPPPTTNANTTSSAGASSQRGLLNASGTARAMHATSSKKIMTKISRLSLFFIIVPRCCNVGQAVTVRYGLDQTSIRMGRIMGLRLVLR